jgi:MFS family permease
LGSFISYVITIIFYNIDDQNQYFWRIMFILGALGAIPIIHLRKKIPESPRWLIYKKRLKEALIII